MRHLHLQVLHNAITGHRQFVLGILIGKSSPSSMQCGPITKSFHYRRPLACRLPDVWPAAGITVNLDGRREK